MLGGVGALTASVLSAVMKIALLVGVGCKLEVQGMLNGPKRKCLSALAMDVCLPCLLFAHVLPEASVPLFKEGWMLLLWPVVYAMVGCIVGCVCCVSVGIPMQHLGSAAACAAFPNVNGFPVSIIAALGPALPSSPSGHSAMVFLALVQLTDGLVKYTVGPVVFRRDLRAVQAARIKEGIPDYGAELPLGASLRSIDLASERVDIDAADPAQDAAAAAADALKEDTPLSQTKKLSSVGGGDFRPLIPPAASAQSAGQGATTAFGGLVAEQFRAAQPEWSRFDAGGLVWSSRNLLIVEEEKKNPLAQPLLGGMQGAGSRLKNLASSFKQSLSQLMPPPVVAVLLALAIGMGPSWMKPLLYDPELTKAGGQPILGFIFGTASQLGGGFVPMQMISLGGRLVNIVGPSGPLAEKGEAGPGGRAKLLKVSAAVSVARMIVSPAVCYAIAWLVDSTFLHQSRPLAFWAPALIVAAMPTANNMSTMADLVGSGRSISAASTAMQLIASPAILAVTLTLMIAGAEYQLAAPAPLV